MTTPHTRDPDRISVEELAESLPEILNRVQQHRDTFIVEHEGVALAKLGPPEPPSISIGELFTQVGNLRMPEGMADDLEAIHAAQGYSRIPEWPD